MNNDKLMNTKKNKDFKKNIKGEKLQKILARAGFGSRRELEKLISQGLVKVNSRTATLGDRALSTDSIKVNNIQVRDSRLAKQPTQVILYNKPEGQVTSRKDEKNRDTVFNHLPRIINARWLSIGRLDINTCGLILFTNNGELANRMMHPSYEVEREYAMRIYGRVKEEDIKLLRKGIKLDDGWAKFNHLVHLPKQDDDSLNQWFKGVINEGRNREIRRLWEAVDLKVNRLIRIKYGIFQLPRNLRRGASESLSWKQVNSVLKSVGMKHENRPDLFVKER